MNRVGIGRVLLTVCLLASPAFARTLEDILEDKKILSPEEANEAKAAKEKEQAATEKALASIPQMPEWLKMITLFGDTRDAQRDLLPGRHQGPRPPALPAALRLPGQPHRRDRGRLQARQRQLQRPDLQQSDLHRRVHPEEHQHRQHLHQARPVTLHRAGSALADGHGGQVRPALLRPPDARTSWSTTRTSPRRGSSRPSR